MDLIKPKLKYVTTVDFGRATYEEDFFALLQENGLSVKEDRVLNGEWLNGQCRMIAASFPVAQLPPANPRISGRITAKARSTGEGLHPANIKSASP